MQNVKYLVREINKTNRTGKVLVCFPFAGGGASSYNSWRKELEDVINVCPVQLPGREDRIMEESYKDMEKLVYDVTEELNGFCDKQLYLFGHSMGAKIAYEVAKKLEENGRKVKLLIVSGSRVPHIPEPRPIYNLPDSEFIVALKRFEGMPKEILENRELLKFFLPMLRADFEMDEIYYTKDAVKLKSPILAIGGRLDKEANENEISEWKQYAGSKFEYKMFKGGHFFIKQHEKEVLDAVRERI
ncbi:thioesterase II family protein [Clostridium tyrobutyricum]|uniref:thioesterase II family protein n=1 Tax=Clostridium tyrobutyricum TaxID=1519 RepID=UPI001C38D2B0|nr:alpha/beta fold hydrolase [Clostridium tyrobutyricum]MBV4429418.1 alpha/beta fold hydrolase [Clostridium tyrobutyricum]MBV4444640.1 alpha/beta fold hydrolase [Clostridium tyrobutyricum]